MLTPRERAASAYNAALAQGRGRIQGIDDADMVAITDARLAILRTAQRTISAARGAERQFLREPDDTRLDQMLARVDDLAETLEGDRGRWEALDGLVPVTLVLEPAQPDQPAGGPP